MDKNKVKTVILHLRGDLTFRRSSIPKINKNK